MSEEREYIDPAAVVARGLAAEKERRGNVLLTQARVLLARSRSQSREARHAALLRAQEEKQKEQERVLWERRATNRLKLLARERELVAVVENIDDTTDPAWLGQCASELAALRDILAVIPVPHAPVQPPPHPFVDLCRVRLTP
ncbi:MAG: hypothetical protein QOJ76_578 [Acidobacteriota bacterium]|nr:hypothetical protein [Acidobacteriota bacterium]